MKLAQFNADGLPLAFYDSEINADALPQDAIEITDDQWLELISHQGRRRFQDGEVVEYQPPAPALTGADVDRERDRRIDAGFVFDGVFYQSDEGSRENIAGAKSAATDAIALGASSGDFGWQRLLDPDAAETFKWIATDNSLHPMDAQTVVRFGYAAMAHKQDMIFKARALKAMDPIPADFASNDAYWA
ncbi:DUF4376 domain-containing protein [Rhizobium oryziradicis]|uniref:DUF4376 domain-containing protein n=1 Tax=Rhizobium oryziradicis TaxID=1867956 RepID=A0A1Q8ZQ35_9HYPH|nr:DUF4376 domain-containing protein [Rhizobium oryziradicis]OLP44166.1 hypothetical protein BJF95_06275 [Rhizobium oryziradicis]